MALVDELCKLRDLQHIDTEIYRREQSLKALDNGETLKQQAILLMKQHDAAQAALHKLEAAQRDRELELKTLEQKRENVHNKLYSGRVTNPKELGDLQKDENMLSGQVGNLEEAVLELMEQTEAARATETKLAEQLATVKRRWKETVTHTQTETARLQQEIAALRPQRDAITAEVDKNLLRRYDEIRRRSDGLGLVEVRDDMCAACHVRLTPQTLNRLREGEEVTLCESCNRMLVLTP